MLRLEVRNAETPIEKKPSWIKTRAVMGPEYTSLKSLVKREGLHTVCESAGTMGLRYATVTGVARDDLPDGGAWLYAETVRQIHAAVPGIGVELLIPDFDAKPDQLAEVFSSRPEVLAHNVETVPRIFRRIRPGFRFERSLTVITAAREAGLVTKSNLILGMGEEPHEVVETM